MVRRTLLCLGILGLAGCYSTGRDFPSDVDWIKKEQTQRDDITLVLGKPFAVGNSGGIKTWTYGYYVYRLWGASAQKELKIYWNPDKSVKHFSFNSSFPDDLRTISRIAKKKAAIENGKGPRVGAKAETPPTEERAAKKPVRY